MASRANAVTEDVDDSYIFPGQFVFLVTLFEILKTVFALLKGWRPRISKLSYRGLGELAPGTPCSLPSSPYYRFKYNCVYNRLINWPGRK